MGGNGYGGPAGKPDRNYAPMEYLQSDLRKLRRIKNCGCKECVKERIKELEDKVKELENEL